ncbi:MAG: S1/P1 Nuclease [Chitinophagaceae bacterium]|nr:S1/P1 Nuclease [Chitinophagaceae bacterium]
MKKIKTRIFITLMIGIIISGSVSMLYGWGAWGHRHINKAAVFALPIQMRNFYYNHIDFITEGSVVPDIRRGVLNDKSENARHYVDIEEFTNFSPDDIPKTPKEITAKYDSAFLQRTGILPWYIQTLTDKLTLAFKRKNRSEIIFISAELGHYVADAHMPLHTASNHDGQLTNQKGIHSFWETHLPQLYGDSYNFFTSDAKYIPDITAETWRIVLESHRLVDTLLSVERKLRPTFPKENLYKKDDSGKVILQYNQPVFSNEYSARYHSALNGMIEKQMRASIQDVADYWYTAWVNGGKPNLDIMDEASLTSRNRKNLKREMKSWKKGRLLYLKNAAE